MLLSIQVNGKAAQEEKTKVSMSLSNSSTTSDTSASVAPTSIPAPEVCLRTPTSTESIYRLVTDGFADDVCLFQERSKETVSVEDKELSLSMSLQQAKERAHKKRSNKRAPQMDWSKRNELFSNLWDFYVPSLNVLFLFHIVFISSVFFISHHAFLLRLVSCTQWNSPFTCIFLNQCYLTSDFCYDINVMIICYQLYLYITDTRLNITV